MDMEVAQIEGLTKNQANILQRLTAHSQQLLSMSQWAAQHSQLMIVRCSDQIWYINYDTIKIHFIARGGT